MTPLSTDRRQAAPQHGLRKHRQEGRDGFREGKGGVRHDMRGVVEQGEQVGLAAAAVARVAAGGGAVQHVAPLQLARLPEGEAAAVLARGGLGGALRQAGVLEQVVDGGGGQARPGWQLPAGLRLAHDRAYGPLWDWERLSAAGPTLDRHA